MNDVALGQRKRNRRLAALSALAVISLIFVPVETLLPGGAAVQPLPVPALRLTALVQPLLLMLLALWAGQRFADRFALGTPLLAAQAAGAPVLPLLRQRLPAILAVALACAGLLLAWGHYVAPLLTRSSSLADFEMPLVTRLLYGGIGEEVMMRWGLLSALAAAGWKLGLGRSGALTMAAILSALLFGVGHLPLLATLAPAAQDWAVPAVVLGNALPGLLFAGLFIRHGLEAAMLAHAGAHLLAWLLA